MRCSSLCAAMSSGRNGSSGRPLRELDVVVEAPELTELARETFGELHAVAVHLRALGREVAAYNALALCRHPLPHGHGTVTTLLVKLLAPWLGTGLVELVAVDGDAVHRVRR